jgi:hypothetical protein
MTDPIADFMQALQYHFKPPHGKKFNAVQYQNYSGAPTVTSLVVASYSVPLGMEGVLDSIAAVSSAYSATAPAPLADFFKSNGLVTPSFYWNCLVNGAPIPGWAALPYEVAPINAPDKVTHPLRENDTVQLTVTGNPNVPSNFYLGRLVGWVWALPTQGK